ncbi:creatininase family protein [Vibrio sp. MA40-2]|uniref:creatininase family protein n=1 Tax=Vibrio sp. MA40-2 TaxID=3391828 RepID=UPI0039A52A04
MLVSQSNWMQIEQYLKNNDVCVLPLGSTEQHAYLSLSVDSILSEKVAQDAAEPLGIPVFPAIPYGITPYFMDFPGTISLKLQTYAALVNDVLESLYKVGFRKILIINGHGGNTPVMPVTMEFMESHSDVTIRFHDWWKAPKALACIKEIDPIASHASWMENFPWTRLEGVEMPDEQKPYVDFSRLRDRDSAGVRKLIGDGNYGGYYQLSDENMDKLWAVAVDEARELLTGDWK